MKPRVNCLSLQPTNSMNTCCIWLMCWLVKKSQKLECWRHLVWETSWLRKTVELKQSNKRDGCHESSRNRRSKRFPMSVLLSNDDKMTSSIPQLVSTITTIELPREWGRLNPSSYWEYKTEKPTPGGETFLVIDDWLYLWRCWCEWSSYYCSI